MVPYRGKPSSDGRRNAGPAGTARAVERAFDVLLEFLNHRGDLGITDLSRRLGLPKSTVHRLVETLASRGFLVRDAQTSRCRVGLATFRLGSLFLQQLDVRQAALPVMRELARQTGETINLNIVMDRRRVCIEKVESDQDIRHHVELGRPLPLYCGASGKVLLAFLDEPEIEAVIDEGLDPLTARTVTDARRLKVDLAEIRRHGHAVSAGERVVGASAVSAPIRDASGTVVAGLTISGPTYRFTRERVGRLVTRVHQGVAAISESLGYAAVMDPRRNRAEAHAPRRALLETGRG